MKDFVYPRLKFHEDNLAGRENGFLADEVRKLVSFAELLKLLTIVRTSVVLGGLRGVQPSHRTSTLLGSRHDEIQEC